MNKSIANKRKAILSFRDLRKKENKKAKERALPGERLKDLFDKGEYEELFADMESRDPLSFPDYAEKLEKLKTKTGIKETVVAGIGTVEGFPVIACEMQKDFMMGSMGAAVGEKIVRLADEAAKKKAALIIFALSGGARMQEGMFSLMQMAKTAAAIKKFKDNGGLFISVLTHPTTGGVSASFANLGNIILAEPKALIGFAGPRVIEQTIHQKLPRGFQRAEFQLEHGFVDKVVPKDEMREVIAGIIKIYSYPNKYQQNGDASFEFKASSSSKKKNDGANNELSAYERVLLSRDAKRPKISDYIQEIFEDFIELSGDRLGGEDESIIGGIARFENVPVTVIGHRKGRTLKENVKCNFGMPRPEGFRKALRLMKEAERAGMPIITFVDTPGAYPGMDAEEHGISTAIAENLAEMSWLKTPIITIVTGEGSSGGALAISVADRIYMLENAVYSVLSPEGFASILWKDGTKAAEASEVMHMTAEELFEDGIIDGVIKEANGGIQNDLKGGCEEIKKVLRSELGILAKKNAKKLLKEREAKYRRIV